MVCDVTSSGTVIEVAVQCAVTAADQWSEPLDMHDRTLEIVYGSSAPSYILRERPRGAALRYPQMLGAAIQMLGAVVQMYDAVRYICWAKCVQMYDAVWSNCTKLCGSADTTAYTNVTPFDTTILTSQLDLGTYDTKRPTVQHAA